MKRIPDSLRRWAPPPRTVRYARTGQAGPFPLPRVVLEETWGELEETESGLQVRRTTRDVTGEPKITEDALLAYTEEGFVDLGTYGADGELKAWSPPQVVLPVDPEAGMSWTTTHSRGETSSEREVSLVACTQHSHCLVSVAEVRRPEGVLVLRMHFGEGDGFGGYEALVQAPGRPEIRMQTEGLTVTRRTEASS